VDIGLPRHRAARTAEARERRQVVKDMKKNAELEKATRLGTCEHTTLLIGDMKSLARRRYSYES